MIDVTRREVNGHPVLDVTGEVDLSTSPALREHMLQAVGPEAPSLLINLAGVTYMDSSGLATLVEGLQRTKERGGRLLLFGLTERIHKIFELAQLHRVFRICADEKEALAGLPAAGE